MAFVGAGGVVAAGQFTGARSRHACVTERTQLARGQVRAGRAAGVRMQAVGPDSPAAAAQASGVGTTEKLPLTWENVELVLDEMRPYLKSDGGDVKIADIDGATVRLELVGACGTCPSSTMTMKMGLERRLLEKIPEIEAVVQVEPQGPELVEENVDKVLAEVRPFLNVAGGSIELVSISGIDSAQPTLRLNMTGTGAAINSVKVEITQRLRRNFPKLSQVVFN
ncbi:NifU-like protein 2, chloroplastic [Porphyridium purpureum]|uniref:NifU-like protein 2, chloroplastic n=1 Tax=Porphyridium purpureum TaxID=35688 RepID=A0A5J4YML6_PORPP|nr:NifU-like protein 2, chloroplastic [Porphyridium purpureum]|eukprot:POR8802..scf244_11